MRVGLIIMIVGACISCIALFGAQYSTHQVVWGVFAIIFVLFARLFQASLHHGEIMGRKNISDKEIDETLKKAAETLGGKK